MNTESQNPNPLCFSPVGFGVMSILVTRAHATLLDLDELLKVTETVLGEELQVLIDSKHVETKKDSANQEPLRIYSATVKGRESFFEQVAWLKGMITGQE